VGEIVCGDSVANHLPRRHVEGETDGTGYVSMNPLDAPRSASSCSISAFVLSLSSSRATGSDSTARTISGITRHAFYLEEVLALTARRQRATKANSAPCILLMSGRIRRIHPISNDWFPALSTFNRLDGTPRVAGRIGRHFRIGRASRPPKVGWSQDPTRQQADGRERQQAARSPWPSAPPGYPTVSRISTAPKAA
jgi:hypothetical protein